MEIPPGFSNTRLIWSAPGVQDQMGISLGCQNGLGQTALSTATKFYDAWAAIFHYAGEAFNAGWTFEGTSTSMNVGGELEVGEKLVPISGTLTNAGATVNLAVLIRKTTALGGRKQRGRSYLPPFSLLEANIEVNGDLNPAYQLGLQTSMDEFQAALELESYLLHLLHSNTRDPLTGVEIPDTAAPPTPIVAFAVQARAATQRRRMR